MIKIIRRTWLPQTLPALAVWFANFALKFADYYTLLGFTNTDKTAVDNANAVVQWLNTAMEVNEANDAALRSMRDQLLYGEKNDPAPTVPTMELPASPAPLISSIIQWLDKFKERIELSEEYTPDIGAQLGIVATPSEGIAEDDVKPTIKAFPASGDYDFAVVVENRAKADQSEILYRPMNQEKFESLKFFTGKSGNAQYKPTPEGAPVKIEIRVQLYRNNEKYGQPSDPTYLTLNP